MQNQIIVFETKYLKDFEQQNASNTISSKNFSINNNKFVKILIANNGNLSIPKELISKGKSAAIFSTVFCKPDAIFFDMDATVIAEESLVEIAKIAGKEQEVLDLTSRAMEGGLDFKESLTLRLSILKGLPKHSLNQVQKTINQGFSELAAWCHVQSIPIFLISGGFIEVAEPVAKKFKFKEYRANKFAWNGDVMAGHTDGIIIDGQGKKNTVAEWCKQYQFNPKNCIAVGDGANDLPMMRYCGLAVGFGPKKTLWPHLDIANHSQSHEFLLHCLSD